MSIFKIAWVPGDGEHIDVIPGTGFLEWASHTENIYNYAKQIVYGSAVVSKDINYVDFQDVYWNTEVNILKNTEFLKYLIQTISAQFNYITGIPDTEFRKYLRAPLIYDKTLAQCVDTVYYFIKNSIAPWVIDYNTDYKALSKIHPQLSKMIQERHLTHSDVHLISDFIVKNPEYVNLPISDLKKIVNMGSSPEFWANFAVKYPKTFSKINQSDNNYKESFRDLFNYIGVDGERIEQADTVWSRLYELFPTMDSDTMLSLVIPASWSVFYNRESPDTFDTKIISGLDPRFHNLPKEKQQEFFEKLKQIDWNITYMQIPALISALKIYPNVDLIFEKLHNYKNLDKEPNLSSSRKLLKEYIFATYVFRELYLFETRGPSDSKGDALDHITLNLNLTPEKEKELFEMLKGKRLQASQIILNNYQNSDFLHNKIEQITRHKIGSPEHEKVMSMLLISPSLLGVNPDNYNELIHFASEFGGKDKHYNDFLFLTPDEKHTGHLSGAGSEEHIENMTKILSWFKDDWRRVLTIFSQMEGTHNIADSIHQLGNALPEFDRSANKNIRQYFFQWSRKANFDMLMRVIKLWSATDAQDNTLPPRDLLMKLINQGGEFNSVKNLDFYKETLQWHGSDMSPDEYGEWEEAYERSQSVPLPKWTEKIVVTEESLNGKKYTGRFLPRSDVRGLHLGEYTNCCQHPDGVGESCAFHGQCSPFGAFFVVEDDRKNIIAQSWVWEGSNRDSVTFDNIETKGLQGREEIVIHIYEKAAEAMGVQDIHIGEGYTKIDISHLPEVKPENGLFPNKEVNPEDQPDSFYGDYWERRSNYKPNSHLMIPLDYDDYTDAENQRVLKRGHMVNKLPENKQFSSISDDEEEEKIDSGTKGWHHPAPYVNNKQSIDILLLARYADRIKNYRLADKCIELVGQILRN